GATASGQIDDRVDDLTPLVGAWPATRARDSGQQQLDQTPLVIAEITGIALPCVVHAARVNRQVRRREGQFLDGLSDPSPALPFTFCPISRSLSFAFSSSPRILSWSTVMLMWVF